MIIQHNMAAMNANRMLGNVTSAQSKSTEKLSSGYRINRAADDAAGLSISEKMRAQIRGLNQASTNAQDGISLIQTAEGGLNETHSILQRMRELAVQASNGTETNDDRQAVADEIKQLQSEIDRISTDTEFNTMKLLDGSLDSGVGGVTGAGPKFGVVSTLASAGALQGSILTSDVGGVKVGYLADTSTKRGGETAVWNSAGNTLTLNLATNTTYSQSDIDALIKNAKHETSTSIGVPADITLTLNKGILTTTGAVTDTTSSITGATAAGTRAKVTLTITSGNFVGADNIEVTMNRFGKEFNGAKLSLNFDREAGKEEVTTTKPIAYTTVNAVDTTSGGDYTIHLAAGKEYTATDIEKLLSEAGFDASVKVYGATAGPDTASTLFAVNGGVTATNTTGFAGGGGVGDTKALWGQKGYSVASTSGGMTLQIGANEGQTMTFGIKDMSTKSLGIDGATVSIDTQKNAQSSITVLDNAIKMVSKERGKLGAVQNRLEHTISNLDTSAENLQSAESRIRDVNMAKQMVEYSKNNILMQASQSMLAQANQSTQGVLSLLQ